MINLLVSVIVLCLVFGLLYWLVGTLPIPDPFASIMRVAVILICILIVIGVAFGGISLPMMRLGR